MRTMKDKEIDRLREIIEQDPDDVKLLRKEYKKLTGKNYRRRK